MPRTKERTAQIFSAPPALGAKLCAQRDLSALFWRLLPQAFWFCHPAQKQQRRAFLQSLRGSMASAFAPPPPPPPADSADSAPVQDGKQTHLFFFATGISVLGQNYKKAAALRAACAPFCFAFKACVHNGVPRVLLQGPDTPVPIRARTTPPPPPLPLPATTNSERSPTKPVTRPRPHVRTARVGPKGARSMYNVRSTVCARLSLSLSLAPHPKRFRSTPQKKIRRLARTARKREVARTWPTRRRRARARLLHTARAREVARTWPSYEMVRDMLHQCTESLVFAANFLWGG